MPDFQRLIRPSVKHGLVLPPFPRRAVSRSSPGAAPTRVPGLHAHTSRLDHQIPVAPLRSVVRMSHDGASSATRQLNSIDICNATPHNVSVMTSLQSIA